MKTCLSLAAVLIVTASSAGVFAQQANTVTATQSVSGQAGPVGPITNIGLPRGVPIPVVISGLNNAVFVTYVSGGLRSSGSLVLGNQLLDLDFTNNFVPMWDGIANPFYRTGANSQWTTNITMGPTSTLNSSAAGQTMIVDPAAPAGARLTAAHQVMVTPGITTINLTLSDDGSQNINLTTYGLTVPFYGTSYSNFFVTGNGLITFNSTTTDFQPSPADMLTGMPRIAMFWTDLKPDQGGTVRVEIDESSPITVVRTLFDTVPEFGVGPPHTFSCEIDIVGNINIINSAFNAQPPTFTCLQGITPGGLANNETMFPTTNMSNLITTPLSSMPNFPIHEWYGSSAAVNWTRPTSNVFDMTNRTISFGASGPDTYFVTAF